MIDTFGWRCRLEVTALNRDGLKNRREAARQPFLNWQAGLAGCGKMKKPNKNNCRAGLQLSSLGFRHVSRLRCIQGFLVLWWHKTKCAK